MRRADRLFQIIQLLRRRRSPVTAQRLAERLGISKRTVYRDVRDLVDSGVPLRGEAGVGYVLSRSYDLPPLMFDETEIEALVLGARIVKCRADRELAAAAENVLAKVESVLPAHLRHHLDDSSLFAFDLRSRERDREIFGAMRHALRQRRKVFLAYEDRHGEGSERVVWPLGLLYWGTSWTLAAWCELRDDFRNFRIDRIVSWEPRAELFPREPGRTIEDLMRAYSEEAAE